MKKAKRLRRLRDWAASRLEHARERYRHWGVAWKQYAGDIREARADRKDARAKLKAINEKASGKSKKVTKKKLRELNAQRVEQQLRIEAANRRIRMARKKKARALYKRRYFRKRVRFWVVKHTRYRDAWKKAVADAREGKAPKYERWMCNGHPEPRGQANKEFIARAVVIHKLTITSTVRTYVPSGGSTTSYHLASVCGCAVDAAGPTYRMVACQKAEYGKREATELFGPDNGLWLKYGSPTSGSEGSALEQLHDSHVHRASKP